jgi:hypothetical protein
MLPGEACRRSSVYLLYSPNLVEDEFCELRLYRILRRSSNGPRWVDRHLSTGLRVEILCRD